MRRVTALAVAGCLVAGPVAFPASAYGTSAYGTSAYGTNAYEGADPVKAFTVSDARITESSGLTASRRHAGVVYTHNDSGGSPQIFAIGPDGETKATFTIAGATARDWEGIASGKDAQGRPALFAADIGDNLGGAWPYITVYRVTEPANLVSQTLRATVFRFKYEDGPRNAESVLINPKTNRLYVASKLFSGALYQAPARLRTSGFNTLRKVGDAPALATDGSFAPDGRSFVIRTYFSAYVYAFDEKQNRPGKLLRNVGLPAEEQGESIAYTTDGRSLLAGSEGGQQPVWRVPLPEDALPSPTATPGRTGQQADERRDPKNARLGMFLVIGIVVAVGFGVIRRRS